MTKQGIVHCLECETELRTKDIVGEEPIQHIIRTCPNQSCSRNKHHIGLLWYDTTTSVCIGTEAPFDEQCSTDGCQARAVLSYSDIRDRIQHMRCLDCTPAHIAKAYDAVVDGAIGDE